MVIRKLIYTDAKEFYGCLKIIDSETNFMMFEPDERVWNEERRGECIWRILRGRTLVCR